MIKIRKRLIFSCANLYLVCRNITKMRNPSRFIFDCYGPQINKLLPTMLLYYFAFFSINKVISIGFKNKIFYIPLPLQ